MRRSFGGWACWLVNMGLAELSCLDALDDGLALTPPQAWTSWNLARFDVSAKMIEEMADALERTGLKALGWNTLQIDEGWESCDEYAGPHPGAWPKNFLTGCATPTPRDSRGWIVANQTKFPGGIKPLVDRLHARGFRVGIYTSASERACGGNWGSHGHERADAAAFATWGIDWVKIDDCNYGTVSQLIENQRAISLALQSSGRPMIIQMGGFVMPSLFNPHAQPRPDYSNQPDQAPWIWGPNISHMWYTGPDKGNEWASTLRNVMINNQGSFSARPGQWNFAGDLWCGTPQSNVPGIDMPNMMSETEERATYAMWVISAAPLMLGCDIRNISNHTLVYLQNNELLAINQDPWGVQGSLVGMAAGGQVYAKPLSDGSFAIALWNLGDSITTLSVTWGMLFPTAVDAMHVRDIWRKTDVGVHFGNFSTTVPAHGVAMIRTTPVKPPPPPPPTPSAIGLRMAPCSTTDSARQRWTFRRDGGLSLANNLSLCLTYNDDGDALVLRRCSPAYDARSCSVDSYVDCHPASWMPGAEGCHLLGCCYKISAPSWCYRSSVPLPNATGSTGRVSAYQQWRWNETDGGVHGLALNVSGRMLPVCFDIREQARRRTQRRGDAIVVGDNGAGVPGAVDGYFPCNPHENPNEQFHYNATTGLIKSVCTAAQCEKFSGQCVTGPGPPLPPPPPPPPYAGLKVWPKPQVETMSGPPVVLSPTFAIRYLGNSSVAKDAAERYTQIIRDKISRAISPDSNSKSAAALVIPSLDLLVLEVSDESDLLTDWMRSENYTIHVRSTSSSTQDAAHSVSARATAITPYGALYACETFSQLVEELNFTRTDIDTEFVDSESSPWNVGKGIGLRYSHIDVVDWPEFPWRSVLLDISRRFYPIRFVKSLISAMSYAKLNVLHLHLTDFGRFSIESKIYPELNVGYPSGGYPTGTGDKRYWTQDQVRDLANYAQMRGIRLIPEIEMPQHSRCLLPLLKTQGLVFCNASFPVMLYDDPAQNTVRVLKKLVEEVAALFRDDVFHLGMDEAQCSVPEIENDPLDAGACGTVCNASTIRSLEHKLLLHTSTVLRKRPMAWQNALFDCGDVRGCSPTIDRVTKNGMHFGVDPPENPATDGTPGAIINMYSASSLNSTYEPGAAELLSLATARGFYATQTDANHLYLDTASTTPAAYKSSMWYDVSGGINLTRRQRELFLGGGVCLWSDNYCNLQAECGGWASCIGGKPDTTKCQGQVGWMQDEKMDARFIESAGGLLFPRSNIAAGTFWHYESALSPTSLEFSARTDALARGMADRGVMGLCPAGCSCSFGSRCGTAYKPTID